VAYKRDLISSHALPYQPVGVSPRSWSGFDLAALRTGGPDAYAYRLMVVSGANDSHAATHLWLRHVERACYFDYAEIRACSTVHFSSSFMSGSVPMPGASIAAICGVPSIGLFTRCTSGLPTSSV
jgi:hypothetical protein